MNIKKIIANTGTILIGIIIGLSVANTKLYDKEEVKAYSENKEVTIAVEHYQANQDGKYYSFYLDKGDYLKIFSNGSWSIQNDETGVYIFQPIELGDYEYNLKDKYSLDNIIETYLLIQNTGKY